MGDSYISFRHGDISAEQHYKTMAIYGLVQPALYGFASHVLGNLLFGGDDDDDDLLGDVVAAVFQNPFNAMPVIDDIFATSVRLFRGEGLWKVFSTPIFDDIEAIFRVTQKKNITFFDVLESFGTFAELRTAAPIKTYSRIAENLIEKMGGSSTGKSKRITA